MKVSGALWYLVLVYQQLCLLIDSLDGRLIFVLVGRYLSALGNWHQNLFCVACGLLSIPLWLSNCQSDI